MVELYKTRLCNLYQRGACHRQSCTFAHGDAELRRFIHGRHDHRGNDLREKLGRRRSPFRSYSPERERRGRHESYGDSPRSFKRDGKRRKHENDDGHSDFSGNVRVSEGNEEKVRDLRRASSESKEFIDGQMRKLESEINLLDEHKLRLENYLEERIKESNSLTSTIHDLELQLNQEKEESRRITSKIKKFVKTYNRQMRLEDELNRSRADFERVCEQLGFDSYQLVDEEDLVFNPSDEVIPADNSRSQRNTIQTNESLSKQRPRFHTEDANRSMTESNLYKGRGEKTSKWNPGASFNNSTKAETNGIVKNVSRTVLEEHNYNTTSKGRIYEPSVVFPSTSMAARAIDDFVDIVEGEEKFEMARTPSSGAGAGAGAGSRAGADSEVVSKIPTLPFLPLPPPPPLPSSIPENSYAEM